MNESKLFFEAEQSDLPRQKTNYCLHADGMALMQQYGCALIREWDMPMEVRPVWVGDRTCMYAWLLPRNYGTTLLLDPKFQARLAEFKRVARIPGPPNRQPRWLALHTGDLPHAYHGKTWADDEFRGQSIQEAPWYTKSCANCDLFDPFPWEEGGDVGDDSSEDSDESSEESDTDAKDDSEGESSDVENAIAGEVSAGGEVYDDLSEDEEAEDNSEDDHIDSDENDEDHNEKVGKGEDQGNKVSVTSPVPL
ncbi:hypothetical protein EYR40_002761 [Pleurotus pulmonarius]|nr:hypothetical protein EYR40_002761 [Pleurotus pulmonarius]KAF4582388.1 hypothetical protein EYR38_002508 [Pleurotus pulmonarius]